MLIDDNILEFKKYINAQKCITLNLVYAKAV